MGDGYVSFYSGGYSSLRPDYPGTYGNFLGYRMDGSSLSSTTSIQSANQVSEVLSRIREGVKNVELSPISMQLMDSIPKQQFKEIHAIMKLTGVKPSVHAPIEDPAGFGERGYEGELARKEVERKFLSVLERAKEVSPDEPLPVVFHSSARVPGPNFIPGDEKKGEKKFKVVEDFLVNKETGQIVPIKEERKYYPYEYEEGKFSVPLKQNKPLEEQGVVYDINDQIKMINLTEWDNKLREIAMLEKEAEDNLRKAAETGSFNLYKAEEIPEEFKIKAESYAERAKLFLRDAELAFKSAFDKAYEYGTEEQRKKLYEMANEWKKEEEKLLEKYNKRTKNKEEIDGLSKIDLINKRVSQLKEFVNTTPPEVFVPAEQFALEKSAQTFGNVAWEGYKRWKDKAPIIAIENLYPGMAFSRADDVKKLVEQARKTFVENAKKHGVSEKDARKKAEQFIGVTWDVGHLNIMKKQGFTDKDIVEETKKIKDLVKHVHLTDNFGYGDTHLAPGMGNVPFKEILKELEKNGQFKEMKKVIEAGALTNPQMGLKISPLKAALNAFGPQVYSGGGYWNQVGETMGSYFGFPLAYMPEKHFSTYGTGFSALPEELGGQIPGTQSRFSGTPNA
ncbi:MAG: sugar phosphate isomerase/epimerase [Candidatus Pacearchaeota archaeon]